MKLMKKVWRLFLATSLSASFFVTGCSLFGNNSSDSSSGNSSGGGNSSTQDEPMATSDSLLKNGKTSYKIVLPDDADADEVLAGERMQSLFKEATGAVLPIVYDCDISSVGSNDEYILIGDNDFAIQNDMVPAQTAVKSTGYTIKTKDKCIYIAGGKSVGTLFGVYHFLGRILNYDYFADDIYSLDKGVTELPLYDYNLTIVPDCEFNTLTHTFLTPAKLKNFSMYAETTTGIHGKTGHGSLNYTLDNANDTTLELAIKNHPNWFSEESEISEEDAAVNDDAIFASTQLCYTAHGDPTDYENLYKRMAQNIIDVFKTNEEAVRFNCSVSDNHTHCKCASCEEETAKYGTPTASVVKLLNKVVETVDAWMQSDEGKVYAREWSLEFYAYNDYQNAPAQLVGDAYAPMDESVRCNKRLVPVVAYVNADYTSPIEAEQNKPYKAQCDAWRSISSTAKMYIYAQNFNYYLIPYNMFGVMSNMYQYWNGTTVYLLTNKEVATGFDSLKIYLAGKLGIDVNANVEELVRKFFKNVYLDASDVMYGLFNEYRVNEQRLKEKYPTDFSVATSCYQKRFINSKYYEATLFDKWRADIDTAIEKIDYLKFDNAERYNAIYKMIACERVWVNYFYWQTNRSNILYETLEDITNDLIYDIEYCGIAYTKEGPRVTTATFIDEMKTFLGGV